jgi:hypothetical protein
MSIDVEGRQSTDGSAEDLGLACRRGDGAMSIDSRRFTLSSSNGANVARTLRAALEALGVGRVDVARELLSELLGIDDRLVEAKCHDAETTGCRCGRER